MKTNQINELVDFIDCDVFIILCFWILFAAPAIFCGGCETGKIENRKSTNDEACEQCEKAGYDCVPVWQKDAVREGWAPKDIDKNKEER
jgi:hypothetical protein